MSVGDLIMGNTTNLAQIDAEWREFIGFVERLDMPFFYVPGNHDITNPVMEQEWIKRFGRPWYHFVYRDVLFLCLNTEDPPRTRIAIPRRLVVGGRRGYVFPCCRNSGGPLRRHPGSGASFR